jgi:glutamyl-tRNA synthetase
VGKKGAVFDQTKLDWLNGVYMRALPDDQLLAVILKDVATTMVTDLPRWDHATLLLLINIYKQRAKTLKELVEDIKSLYEAPRAYVEEDIAQWITANTRSELEEMISFLNSSHEFTADALSALCKEFAKTKNIKIVSIAQPLRIALIGKSSGPGVFDLMAVLGKHETIARVEKLVRFIASKK